MSSLLFTDCNTADVSTMSFIKNKFNLLEVTHNQVLFILSLVPFIEGMYYRFL